MSDPSPSAPPPEPVRDDLQVFLLRRRVEELEGFIERQGLEVPGAKLSSVPPPPPPPLAPHAPSAPGAPQPASASESSMQREGSSATERFVGTRIAALLGGIAVLVAIGLFIKYAVDNGWLGRLGPGFRFGAGIVVAALFIVAAEVVRKRWTRETSIGLYGAGVAALFVTVAGGVFWLDLFDPLTGSVLGVVAAIIGALVAARSKALAVALLGLIGGFAIPASTGILQAKGTDGGYFLTALLAIALVMVSAGPPSFTWLRVAALAIGGPLGFLWAGVGNRQVAIIAVAVAIWWGMMTASCLVEALRARNPRLNAVALAVASLMSALVSVAALSGPSAWSDPLSYLPLGIAAGLGVIALQFRDSVGYVVGSDRTTESEEPDESTRAVLVATGTLARTAALATPLALVIALGVLLPSGASAVAAAACVCWLAMSRRFLGNLFVLLALIPSLFYAVGAAGVSVLQLFLFRGVGGVGAPWAWQWSWPDWSLRYADALTEHLHIAIGSHQVGPAAAAVLLMVPLARTKERDYVAHACAAAGTLVAIAVLASMFGAWSGPLAVAAIAFAIGSIGPRASRWLPYLLALVVLAFMAWTGTLIAAVVAPRSWNAHLAPLILVLVAICAGLWWLRGAMTARFQPMCDAFALGAAVAGSCLAVFVHASQPDFGTTGAVSVLLVSLALGTVLMALVARARRNRPMALLALVPIVPALATVFSVSVTTVFGAPFPDGLGSDPMWALATFAPLAALAVSRSTLRESIEGISFLQPLLTHGAALLLVWAWCTAVVALGVALGGNPAPHLLIASIALAGAIGLLIGFRRNNSSFRWIGLGMFGMLALRLFVVDLREMSTMFRVGVLFATGLVLVGTSIAYTLVLKPRKSA